MIYTEQITINGRNFTKTYSDLYHIERDGVQYAEAVDLPEFGYVYTETDIPLTLQEAEPQELLERILAVVEGES